MYLAIELQLCTVYLFCLVVLGQRYDKSELALLRYSLVGQRTAESGVSVELFDIDEVTGIVRTTVQIDRDLLCHSRPVCVVQLDVLLRPGPSAVSFHFQQVLLGPCWLQNRKGPFTYSTASDDVVWLIRAQIVRCTAQIDHVGPVQLRLYQGFAALYFALHIGYSLSVGLGYRYML